MVNTTFAQPKLIELAQRMVQQYARDLVSVDWLYEQLVCMVSSTAGMIASDKALELLARSLSSRVLYEACLSNVEYVRERGFEHLRNYLARVLMHAMGGNSYREEELRAETLQQTLVEIFKSLHKQAGGPGEPTAFLKWARVILFRQLFRCQQRARNACEPSLEEQSEPALAHLVDHVNTDPLETVLRGERAQELRQAIAAIRNPQYRAVLINLFFVGLEERELAVLWQVRVRDISLWRCRALKSLRKQPGLLQVW
jgi:RNA polymerase sigma factor (sigma-70 family)